MKIDYWDSESKSQKQRDMTPDELAQREIDIAAAAKPLVPQVIPMLNAHLVMIEAGWMPAVQACIDSIPGVLGERARTYFEMALTMRRDHEFVLTIPMAIGKTEAEVDALFIAAAALG